MNNERNNSGVVQWRNAKTLAELGELTANWLEGKLSYYPCYGDDADSETTPISETLAYYNRNGLVTTFSQPGESLDEEGFAQRAAVEGFAPEETAKKLAVLGLCSDLLVFIFPPNRVGGYRIPITLSEFQPFSWCGASWGYEELECFAEICSPEAINSLEQAWKVTIIDLQWGRENYLWTQVRDALTKPFDKPFSVSPADSELGKDFIF